MVFASDVIIIGGGPTGSFAALNLGKKGIHTLVFEEHKQIGIPSHCAGHISIKGLNDLGLPHLPQEIIENFFYGVQFHSPTGKNFSVRFPHPVTCIVNRAFLDKYIANLAEETGVKYHLNSRVESLIIKDGIVKGVKAKVDKEKKVFTSKIVLDAEGASSTILRQSGLSTFNQNMLITGIQAEVENVKDVEPDIVEVFLGKKFTPDFYSWLIPKGDGFAKIGLATKKGNPLKILKYFMRKHPSAAKKLSKAKFLKKTFHPLSLGGQIPKIYSNGFLAVGDVASQVKPTTGGGIIFGLNSSKISAEVISEALKINDFSDSFLSKYQHLCGKKLGLDLKIMLRIRQILNSLSDEKLDKIINLSGKLHLEKSLSKMDVDFHGRSIFSLLRDSSFLLFILRFFFR